MLPLPELDAETIAVPDTKKTKAPKPPKVPKAEKVVITPTEDGMILYADAGARPNPGFGGWGFHGYTYSDLTPKKGVGLSGIQLTTSGYLPKVKALAAPTPETDFEREVAPNANAAPAEVTALHYVDAFGTIDHVSNNGGEVKAATEGMAYAIQYPIKKLTIYTDSQYVVKGTEQLPRFKANDWCKTDGNVVGNLPYWQALDTNLSALKDKGVNVSIKWIKGHNGNHGNEIADKYATMGVFTSAKKKSYNDVTTSVAEGYWTGPQDKHTFITHRRCYLSTNPQYSTPGEYYLGEHGKDDELLGDRMSDGAYAYVLLTTPDPYIEIVRTKLLTETKVEDALVMIRLDRLYEVNSRSLLMRFGGATLFQPKAHRLNLCYVDNLKVDEKNEDPVAKELLPPRIAMRAILAVNALKGLLLDYQHNPQTLLIATDITSTIYDITTPPPPKGSTTAPEPSYALRNIFTPGNTTLPVRASYAVNSPEELFDVSLTLGLDLPDRNTWKRLEKHRPTVTVVVWKESPVAYRYATIVKTADAVGIWAAYYTNFKYLVDAPVTT